MISRKYTYKYWLEEVVLGAFFYKYQQKQPLSLQFRVFSLSDFRKSACWRDDKTWKKAKKTQKRTKHTFFDPFWAKCFGKAREENEKTFILAHLSKLGCASSSWDSRQAPEIFENHRFSNRCPVAKVGGVLFLFQLIKINKLNYFI